MASRPRLLLAAMALLLSAGAAMAAAPKTPALESARVALRMRDYPSAVEKLRQSGNAGSAEAQLLLGLMELNGVGMAINRAEAETWLRAKFNITQPGALWPLSPALSADPRMIRGSELWAVAAYDDAKGEFNALTADNEKNPLAMYELASYYFRIGLYRSAIETIAKLLDNAKIETIDAPKAIAAASSCPSRTRRRSRALRPNRAQTTRRGKRSDGQNSCRDLLRPAAAGRPAQGYGA